MQGSGSVGCTTVDLLLHHLAECSCLQRLKGLLLRIASCAPTLLRVRPAMRVFDAGQTLPAIKQDPDFCQLLLKVTTNAHMHRWLLPLLLMLLWPHPQLPSLCVSIP